MCEFPAAAPRLTPRGLVGYGVLLLAIGALVLSLLASGPAFVIGMAVVALAYAMAIPNILAESLQNYTDRLGTAGAILSMLYYTLLGLGLVVAGWGQRLDLLVLACAMLGALAFRGGQLGANCRGHTSQG